MNSFEKYESNLNNASVNITDITKYLYSFKKSNEENNFSVKAIESLVKKLAKENREELDSLILTIKTQGKTRTKCITIARTLDGRLQINGKKGFPHVIYARIWRWPTIHRNEIFHCEFCFNGFNLGRSNVCVNPYHYERRMAVGQIPMTVETASTNNCNNDGLSILPAIEPTLLSSRPPFSSTYQRPIFGSCRNSHEARLDYINGCHFNSEENNEKLISETSSFLGDMKLQKPLNLYSNSFSVHINEGDYPTTSSTTNQEFNSNQLVNYQTNDLPYSSAAINYAESSIKESNDDTSTATLLNSSYWCTIFYYEVRTQVGPEFKVPYTIKSVVINGGTDSLATSGDKFCLGSLENKHRTERSEQTRKRIGAGIRFTLKDNGSVWLVVLRGNPVYMESNYLDREAGRTPGGGFLHTIYPPCEIKVFDQNQCLQNISRENLNARCTVKLSFARISPSDENRRIINTPCWIKIQIDQAFRILEEKLKASPIKPSLTSNCVIHNGHSEIET